jgi:hypothetical protein
MLTETYGYIRNMRAYVRDAEAAGSNPVASSKKQGAVAFKKMRRPKLTIDNPASSRIIAFL